MVSQFEDLQACYLSLRRAANGSSGDLAAQQDGAPAANGHANGGDAAGSRGSAAAMHAEEPEQAGGSGGEGPVANGSAGGSQDRQVVARGERPLGAVIERNGFAEFSRMLSVFTHCSKLKARSLLYAL